MFYKDVHEEDLGEKDYYYRRRRFQNNELNNKMKTWRWKLFYILFQFCFWFYFEQLYVHFCYNKWKNNNDYVII
jgi:hypothetical protein